MTTIALVSGPRTHHAQLGRFLGPSVRVVDVSEGEAAAPGGIATRAAAVLVHVGTPARPALFRRRVRLVRDLAARGATVVATLDGRSDRALQAVQDAGAAEYIVTPLVKQDVLHQLKHVGVVVEGDPGRAPRRAATSTVSPGPSIPSVSLPELHDEASGRIDAAKVASYLGVPLKDLAAGLGLNYKAVHKTPASASVQPALRPVKRALELLHDTFHEPGRIRAWLQTPRPELEHATPIETILAGEGQAVADMLEGALLGIPA